MRILLEGKITGGAEEAGLAGNPKGVFDPTRGRSTALRKRKLMLKPTPSMDQEFI